MGRRRCGRAGAIWIAAVVTAAGASAGAQPRSEAEERYERGVALYTARNYEGALAEFQRSFVLSDGVDLLFNIGRTYQAMARYPEAATAIEEYLRRARDLSRERRDEVTRILETLRAFIAHLRVRVTPADAAVSIDGEAVARERLAMPLAVGPGRHVVAAQRPGFATRSEAVVVASGDSRDVTLALLPAPSGDGMGTGTIELRGAPPGAVLRVDGAVVRPPARLPVRLHRVELSAPGYAPWRSEVLVEPQGRRVLSARLARTSGLAPGWFVAAATATGAMLVLGGVFGALTASAGDEFASRERYADSADDRDLASRGETLRLVTNVSFGLAAALGVASVVVLTRTRFGSAASSVDVAVGPGGVGLRF